VTIIEITTGSKAEAAELAAKYGGEMCRAGLLRWKVTIRSDGEADVDAVAAKARELGCSVTWN
jgi:hypothetical protein